MKAFLVTLVLLCGLFGKAHSQDEAAPRDPVLGDRLIRAVATTDRLWVTNDKGAVVVFDRSSGTRAVLAEEGVIDLVRHQGRTVALKKAAGDRLDVIDIDNGEALTPSLETKGGSLLISSSGWIVLTPGAVFRHDGQGWTRTPIDAEARRFGVATTAATADGSIYIGYNQGEWGGGLWRIAPGATTLTQISKVDDSAEPCRGPLAAVCQPVTGVIPDPSSGPDCVIVATGLSHFFAKGAVMRVCGERVEMLFEAVIPQKPGTSGEGQNTWPMFGLVATPGGWTSVSPGKLFVSKEGAIRSIDMPEVTNWHGLGLGQGHGLLILRTDVNAGMSLSGYTPMLVPIVD